MIFRNIYCGANNADDPLPFDIVAHMWTLTLTVLNIGGEGENMTLSVLLIPFPSPPVIMSIKCRITNFYAISISNR